MAISGTDSTNNSWAVEYSLPKGAAYSSGSPMTTAVYLQPEIDFSALAQGDRYQISIYETINGTQRLTYRAYVDSAQSEAWTMPGRMVKSGWDLTLKSIAGSTARAIAWAPLVDNSDANVATWLGSVPNALAGGRVDSIVGAYASGQAPLQPTVAGRTLDVSAGGEAGIDLANVGSPTTVLNLSGTTIKNATDVKTVADTIATYVDTEVAAIKAKTDNLPADPASASTIAGSFSTVNSTLATIAGYVDTEIASILSAVSALPSAATIAAAVIGATIETGESLADTLRLHTAVLLGKATEDNDAGTFTFFAKDGVTARIVGTIVGTLRSITTRNGA